MPKFIALEWDPRELRLLLAEVGRHRLRLLRAVRVELPPLDEGERGPHPQLAAKLRSTIAAYRWERVPVLLSISRAAIELRTTQVPPAPAAELPQLVRNALVREMGAAAEAADLDFVPSPLAEDGSQTVLAALLAADARAQLDELCAEAELRPRRFLVRPFGAVALCRRRWPADTATRFVVDASAYDADLTILCGPTVAFCRSTRLPPSADGDDRTRPLVEEIRRTLIAFQNQPGAQPVSELVLCGAVDEDPELAANLAEQFELPVVWLDPWSEADAEFDEEPPTDRGRFTALVGLLREEADRGRHAIDFLHPRRPPTRWTAQRRPLVLAGAVVGLTLAAVIGWHVSARSTLDQQIADLRSRQKSLKEFSERATAKQAIVEAVDAWQRGDRVWLDELSELSQRFPPRRDAVVQRLSLSKGEGVGRIELEGLVRDPAIVGRLEEKLRDPEREVQSRSVQEEAERQGSAWQFETSITLGKLPSANPPRTASRGARP